MTTKALLAKIGNALLEAGIPRETAARIACSVVVDELTKNDIELSAAFDMVYGAGNWESLQKACEV